MKQNLFRNKTFLFFKIESWNFQHLFKKEFHETSQNFNSFRQLLFLFFYQLSDWVEILWGFTKFFFKQRLKISAFYLVKQNKNISKKIWLRQYQNKKKALFIDPIFSDGFECEMLIIYFMRSSERIKRRAGLSCVHVLILVAIRIQRLFYSLFIYGCVNN